MLGKEAAGKLQFAGTAFLTLSGEPRNELLRRVECLATSSAVIKLPRVRKPQWVKPELLVRVRHLAGGDTLRHATVLEVTAERKRMKPIVAGLTIAKLTADDQALLELLRAAGLPTSDLQTGVQKRFIGLHDGSVLVAAGGLERHGCYGLLRSLVVAESHRGSGKGKHISERLISEARALGLEELYLLTTTAERFFQRIGFERVRRESVPTPIQQTAEFSELCPKSAIVMRYKL